MSNGSIVVKFPVMFLFVISIQIVSVTIVVGMRQTPRGARSALLTVTRYSLRWKFREMKNGDRKECDKLRFKTRKKDEIGFECNSERMIKLSCVFVELHT
jgi:hypothetical protein